MSKENHQRTLTDTVGLVEEVVAVAQRFLCILIDRNSDRLNVLIAVALARGDGLAGARIALAIASQRLESKRAALARPLAGQICSE
jgi:hypothetical protein